MKVYVGAPLRHFEAARKAMSALRSMGHDIAHDWTIGAEAYFGGDHSEKPVDIATSCINGVRSADFALFLPLIDVPMQGTWVELGAALALDKPVIVYAPFLHCPEAMRPTVDAWMMHQGAFFAHPLCDVNANYTDCFRRIEIVANELWEQRSKWMKSVQRFDAQRLKKRFVTQLENQGENQ